MAIRPHCPFCGYDVGGDPSLRGGQRDQRGRCPECGVEFDRSAAVVPRPRIYDASVRGLGPALAWRTFLRTLWPPSFWKAADIDRPLRSARLGVWLLLVPFMVFALQWLLNMVLWKLLADGWGQDFWPMTRRLELLVSPYYDAGEMTREGTVEPRPFPDRRWAAVEAAWAGGSLAALILLPLAEPAARRRAARAIAYGCAPIVIHLLLVAIANAIRILSEAGVLPGPNPVVYRALRMVLYPAALWTPIWWYTAVAGTVAPRARLRGVVAAALACVTMAGVFYYAWAQWEYV